MKPTPSKTQQPSGNSRRQFWQRSPWYHKLRGVQYPTAHAKWLERQRAEKGVRA